jgi:leader peptidase (prepilin peptidase) / N-methyltransferase
MIRALQKTCDRTSRFLANSLAWRTPDRHYGIVSWGLLGGAVWSAAGLAGDAGWKQAALAGLYLVVILAAICAIDARYGIIPNSLVLGLAAGGLMQTIVFSQESLFQRGCEVAIIFALACLFRGGYRWARGYQGLGFGDVKFVTAAVLWVGLESIPGLLLIAVLSAVASLLVLKSEGHELHGGQAISFGPHLAVGLWVIWVFAPLRMF